MDKICKSYVGVSCVDGTCPIANRDEYIERGYDVVNDCNECHHYKGCEDCVFAVQATENCPKNQDK